jgi:asparagine synthase (glutamine-hydrolysing)
MKDEPALQQLTRDTLERLKPRRIFRDDFIDSALAKHQSDHSGYYGELIWIMVVLELWLESRNL